MMATMKRIIQWSGDRKKRLYIGFVYSFFNTLFTAMSIMGAAYGLNLIVEDMQGRRAVTGTDALYMLLFMIAVVLGRYLFAYLRAVAQESIGYEVTAEKRIQIGDILKRVPLGFFSTKSTGEITSAVTTDLSFFELFGMKMIDVVVNGYISAFTIVLCMLFFNGWIALIAAAGIALSAVFLRIMGNHSHKNAPLHQQAQDKMIAATIEYIRGMPVVKAFKQGGASIQGIQKAYRESREFNIKIEKNYVPYNCMHLFALKAASIGIVLVSALLTLHRAMTIPEMLMMVIFSFVIFGHVEAINNATHVMEIIDATLDKLETIETAAFIDQNGQTIAVQTYDVCFDHVTFAYDRKNVLSDISFSVPQNTTTAIVGPSGSGKTTICSLIARFYDADTGHVLVGGVDVKEMTCDSVLKNISMVFQKVYLFHDSILNNIRFGKPDASLEEVMDAAKKARCHDFIMALPNGYETVIGEGGATLSGGEKQRISIARAILKNAPIVILDEATASVDPENERAIQQAIEELVHGKTMIIIAHRLATIEHADQILVINEGRVAQRGTHDELIRVPGTYADFIAVRQKALGWKL